MTERRSHAPTIIVEPSPDTPLVWFDIAIRGGAALDPSGVEVARQRQAGQRDRVA